MFAVPSSTERCGDKTLRRSKADAWVVHMVQAHVIHVDGRKAQKLDLKTEAEAQALAKRIAEACLQVWH